MAFLLSPLRVFGHISFRSDWELVKVDFRPSFPRQCGEDDYSSWDLTDLQVGHEPAATGSFPLPGHLTGANLFSLKDVVGHPRTCSCSDMQLFMTCKA